MLKKILTSTINIFQYNFLAFMVYISIDRVTAAIDRVTGTTDRVIAAIDRVTGTITILESWWQTHVSHSHITNNPLH
jgi:hypothetical protein